MGKTYSWFGIDFGTTNSAAFSFTGADQETIRPISYGDDEGRPMPSAIAINRNTGEVITGREAKDQRNVLSEDYEYISSVKLLLDQDIRWNIAGSEWSNVQVVAEIFKALKKKIEQNGENFLKETVMAVPVGFSAEKKKKLRQAASIAGFEIKMFISEPTAAFCSNYNKLKNCKNVAVFDWGGGTLDVAVIQITEGRITELATEGIDIAGDHIDRKLAEKMHAKFTRGKEPVISFDNLDARTKDQLLLKCEEAKCNFSDEYLVSVSINRYANYGAVKDVLDYDYFSLLIEKEVSSALDCLERAIFRAGLTSAELDCILCVGGSSKLRPFREKLEAKYGSENVYYPQQVMWDIARGAAMISMNPGGYGLSRPIGLLLNDGNFLPLLSEGQQVPCQEVNLCFAITDDSSTAKFIITDAKEQSRRSFVHNLPVPARGFLEEQFELSCFVDPDFVFKLKIRSNKTYEKRYVAWSYENLNLFYKIEGA